MSTEPMPYELKDMQGQLESLIEFGGDVEPIVAYWFIRDHAEDILKALSSPRIESVFGLGQVAVTLGEHGGSPCVYLAPARIEGKKPGDAVDNTSEGLQKYSMREDESVLTFPSAEQAKRVQRALCNVAVEKEA